MTLAQWLYQASWTCNQRFRQQCCHVWVHVPQGYSGLINRTYNLRQDCRKWCSEWEGFVWLRRVVQHVKFVSVFMLGVGGHLTVLVAMLITLAL
jgi:hypothetical protein